MSKMVLTFDLLDEIVRCGNCSNELSFEQYYAAEALMLLFIITLRLQLSLNLATTSPEKVDSSSNHGKRSCFTSIYIFMTSRIKKTCTS